MESIRIVNRIFALGLVVLASACSVLEDLSNTATALPTPVPPAKLYDGATVSGAWTPAIANAGTINQKGSVTTDNRILITRGAGMVRFQDNWINKEVTVDLGDFDSEADFGYDANGNGNGSLTLSADVINYPYTGGAYPVLTSLRVVNASGVQLAEFVNVTSSCASQGMWTCAGGYCDANSACTVQSPSTFFNRDDWDQHQTPPFGYSSINSFPRCDSAVGTPSWSACPAGLNKLPTGRYFAKFVLMSDRNLSVASGSADLRVRVTVKKDTIARNDPTSNGAINLNVILVGNSNIDDSHTPKGAQNLNLLFGEVNRILQNTSNISIGDVKVYEWRDLDGGDYYSQIDYTQVGDLFMSGSQGIPLAEEGNAVNVFMVKDIQISGANFTILGLAGAILGPPVNGSYSSGLAFSTNVATGGLLSSMNPSGNCTLSSCPRNSHEGDFLEMGATIAHELGHYLGLNHPSEKVASSGETQRVDQLSDTPTCAARQVGASMELNQYSCFVDTATQFGSRTCSNACNSEIQSTYPTVSVNNAVYFKTGSKTSYYCPLSKECQYNHVMWYTTKERSLVSGQWREDGNIFSDQSSAIIQWSPFVR